MGQLAEFAVTWQLVPLVAVALSGVTVAYLAAALTVTGRHPSQPWRARHTLFFLAGVLVLLSVTLGPIGAYDDTFFWAHMAQHIALMMLAAPLLLLGEPVLLVLRVCSRDTRRRYVVPFLHSRIVRFATHPVVAWLVFAGVLMGTHFTGFYEYALAHPPVHDYVEHALFLGAGLLYFYPLLGTSPGAALSGRAKVASMALMMALEVGVGVAIASRGQVMYLYYSAVTERPWGPPTALADQRLAGELMWSTGLILNAGWLGVAGWKWVRSAPLGDRRNSSVLRKLRGSRAGLEGLASP